MKRVNKLPLLLSLILFSIISCEKEGPPGAEGPQGPAGVAGPAGPAGPTGTANVIYSAWFTPDQNGGWLDTTINGVTLQKKFNKPAPGLTLAILNTGLVLSYVKLNPDGAGGTTISTRQLPYANPGTATQFIILSRVGSITFAAISTASPGVAVPVSSGGLEFRYLIIPGGVAGGRSSTAGEERFAVIDHRFYTAAELQAMSYEQVCALLNIPD